MPTIFEAILDAGLKTDLRRLASGQAQAKTATGVFGVEVELAAFARSLEKYLIVFPQNVGVAVRTTAFDLEGRIKRRAAVDTGRLRASFHTVMSGDNPTYTYTDKDGKTFTETLPQPAHPVTGIIEAIVGTAVEYASHIEARGGRNKPPGMVRVSVAEMRGELDRAVAQALRNSTDASLMGG